MSGMTIYVVLLYGIYSPERAAYGAYLDRVSEELSDKERSTVVLCGGITNPNYPDLSEAKSAQAYLKEKGIAAEWLLEESSLTTFENIHNAANLLANKVDNEVQYVVLGDVARKAKISWLAMHLLCKLPVSQAYELLVNFISVSGISADFIAPRLRVVGLEYESGALPENLDQTFSTIRDIVPLDHPELREVTHEMRRREFRIS